MNRAEQTGRVEYKGLEFGLMIKEAGWRQLRIKLEI